MLRTLDPHSSFFDPDQFHQLQADGEERAERVRERRQRAAGARHRVAGFAGNAVRQSRTSAGDEILAINEHRVRAAGVRADGATAGRGAAAQGALDIRHPGERATGCASPCRRSWWIRPRVDRAFLLAPGIGYLRITSFEEPTGKLVKETIEKLGGRSEGPDSRSCATIPEAPCRRRSKRRRCS